jgi:hypothetical protein
MPHKVIGMIQVSDFSSSSMQITFFTLHVWAGDEAEDEILDDSQKPANLAKRIEADYKSKKKN